MSPHQCVLLRVDGYEGTQSTSTLEDTLLHALGFSGGPWEWDLVKRTARTMLVKNVVHCLNRPFARPTSTTYPLNEYDWYVWMEELAWTVSEEMKGEMSVVCSGYAPLPVWMLLGHVLTKQGRRISVLNFHKTEPPALIDISAAAQHGARDTHHLGTPRGDPTGAEAGRGRAAALFVTQFAGTALSPSSETSLVEMVPQYQLHIWQARPPLSTLTVDKTNFSEIKSELRNWVKKIISTEPQVLLLATSMVDGVALYLGGLITLNDFRRVVFCEFFQYRYFKAFDLPTNP